ncbi:MAG TPA: glutamate--tRNA ligase, partial [Thermoanaerobaculia bacterium]
PFLVPDESIDYEPDAVKKHVKGDDLADRMTALHNALAEVEPFDITTTEAALRGVAELRGLSAGKLIHPMRLALTGRGASPPIFDVAVALGRDRTLRRLKRLIEKIPELLS